MSSQVVWKANVVQVVWKANAKCRPSCLEGKCQMLSKLSGRQMSSKFSGRQMSSKWSGRQMLSSSLEVFATFLLYFFYFFLRTQQGWGLWGPMWEPRSFKHLWSLYTKLIYSAIQSYPLLAVFLCYKKNILFDSVSPLGKAILTVLFLEKQICMFDVSTFKPLSIYQN